MLLFLDLAVPEPYWFWPCCVLCQLLVQHYWTLWLSGTAFLECSLTRRTNHRLAPSHEPVCFVNAKVTLIACALLEFTKLHYTHPEGSQFC